MTLKPEQCGACWRRSIILRLSSYLVRAGLQW